MLLSLPFVWFRTPHPHNNTIFLRILSKHKMLDVKKKNFYYI